MKKSCQDLEKDLFKILQESGQKSSNTRFSHGFGTRILQDKKDSCKFEKLAWIWNRFLANLKRLGKILQDIFDRAGKNVCMYVCGHTINPFNARVIAWEDV